MEVEERLNIVTEKIIGAAFKVGNTLGAGFYEKVYENAMVVELLKNGLSLQQQVPFAVRYDNVVVGDYVADLIVEDLVIVELKAIKAVEDIHVSQCINYLTASKKPIALLINFQKRVEVKRIRL